MDSEDKPQPPARRKWRRADRDSLAADAAIRQGQVIKLALSALGSRDEAIAYLNTACERLGARPLDLAVESAAGLGRVERALAERAAGC